MKQSLGKKLVKAFPNLYKDLGYFEICDGWFDIIWDLSENLEKCIVEFKQGCLGENDVIPYATQIKEKFGGLRFYMNFETEEMTDYIDDAISKSSLTCETCGKPGKIRGNRWLMCECDECWERSNGN